VCVSGNKCINIIIFVVKFIQFMRGAILIVFVLFHCGEVFYGAFAYILWNVT